MRAPISLCIITRDEALLDGTLQSARDHVAEIIVIDTAPTGELTRDICRMRDVDWYERYTSCNGDTGLIEDFSLARQRSFELATQPWVLWADSDDVISGADQLAVLVAELEASRDLDGLAIGMLFPYEYDYDANGNCASVFYRERLCRYPERWHWVNPVHEVCIPRSGFRHATATDDRVVYKHMRHLSKAPRESGRNLRILRAHVARHGSADARMLYYLGIECHENGLPEQAIAHLEAYVARSGWDDEKLLACLRLSLIYELRADWSNARRWAFEAIVARETWGEGYFALARICLQQALAGSGQAARRDFERCVAFSRRGLELPNAQTLLFCNPLERALHAHRYISLALNALGDVRGALESCEVALRAAPNDPQLLSNRREYVEFLTPAQPMITGRFVAA
jgi:tetratricopeptide (TPR) repeat protein